MTHSRHEARPPVGLAKVQNNSGILYYVITRQATVAVSVLFSNAFATAFFVIGCSLRASSKQAKCNLAGPHRPWRGLYPRGSGEVEPISVHHLAPRRHEVLDKRLLIVIACVDFGQSPQLRVRAKDKVNTRAGPFDVAGFAITPLEHVFGVRGWLPLHAHVEQVDKKVVAQCFWPRREHTVCRQSVKRALAFQLYPTRPQTNLFKTFSADFIDH